MKIFIIGSNSFMGSSLINYIQSNNNISCRLFGCSRGIENYEYFNLYRNKKNKDFKFYRIDLNKDINKLIKILKKVKPNIIFNFAAQSIVEYSWKKPADWFNTNLISNIQLIEYLKNADYLDKYIHSSTPEVYGSTDKKIIENYNYNPSTPYATSKASIDMLLKNYNENYNFPVIFTRASNIYGPGQRLYKIIPKTIISIMKGKKIPLHGKGLSKRSFIYSDDVSEAMLKVMKKSKNGEIYHITNEKMYSIKEVVNVICKVMDKKFDDHVTIEHERPGKDFIYDLSGNKIKSLRWKPKTSLINGILETKKWIEENYLCLKKIKLKYEHLK
jgi:dTDP-glucose 4,6-dehydratase